MKEENVLEIVNQIFRNVFSEKNRKTDDRYMIDRQINDRKALNLIFIVVLSAVKNLY